MLFVIDISIDVLHNNIIGKSYSLSVANKYMSIDVT